MLASTKQAVLQQDAKLAARGLQNREPALKKASGFAFYNTFQYDFERLLQDAPHLGPNLRKYVLGEHFTPREVIRLMANLLLAPDEEALGRNYIVRAVYDPCCGSGGMLTIAKERILELNQNARVYLFGQEVNPETWAIARSDLLLTSPGGSPRVAWLGDDRNHRRGPRSRGSLKTRPSSNAFAGHSAAGDCSR